MEIGSFIPHPVVRGGHLQTIIAHLIAKPPVFQPEEVLTLSLPDHDQVAIDINLPRKSDARTPVVVLFHGLAGCSESRYNVRIAQKLAQAGFRTARYNHRGCGRHKNLRAKSIYHSGSVEDIYAAIEAVAKRWPKAPILATAFSLSGTIMLNLLGSRENLGGELPQLKRVLCVCPPLDLVESARAISSLRNAHLNRYYVKELMRYLQQRQEALPVLPSAKRVTLALFDDVYTAPRAGFRDGLDYYRSCSPKQVVQKIKLPTTILTAADDPLIPLNTVTRAPFSDQVSLRIEKSGGHMGFIAHRKTPYGDYRWMDQAIVAWAEAFSKKSSSRSGLASGTTEAVS